MVGGALPLPLGRLWTAAQLRAYLGGDSALISRLKKQGVLPRPLPGTRRYDREAVIRALDQASGIEGKIADAEQRLIGRARQWGNSR